MILLQLSSGQGPIECCQAVGLAVRELEKQCRESGIGIAIVETIDAKENGCFKSLLLKLESTGDDVKARQLAANWQGSMLWICQSRFRPKHKRKNWFFSGAVFEVDEHTLSKVERDKEVTFQTCRASGAGGQHVNTTDSAVRATHNPTGVSVRVESERSQHANKRLAFALLSQKLETLKIEQQSAQEKERWQQHWDLERGNPKRTFEGIKFKEKR